MKDETELRNRKIVEKFTEYYSITPKVIRENRKSKWTHRWFVENKRDYGKKTYVVSMAKGQEFGCSCPVYKFRREECKHIQGVKTQLFQHLMEERLALDETKK